MLPRLDTYEQDGALWARSSAYGDDDDRVLHPLASGGAPTYRAADVVYLADKLDRGFDRAIYVLGADHHGTRNWYAAVARMLGYDPERVEVLLYQLVHLTRGGEQTKMSKRRGDVVFLDDFMDEIGVDAARWYLVEPRARPDDRDRHRPRGREVGQEPGLLRPVRPRPDRGDPAEAPATASRSRRTPPGPLAPEERELVKRLVDFRRVVAEAAERRGPQAIPTYAIRVADDFHRFYHHHRVVGSERVAAVPARPLPRDAPVIARCLDLVGVEAPERM